MTDEQRAELRMRARLAWNNYPSTPEAETLMRQRDEVDPVSSASWDRVVDALLTTPEPLSIPVGDLEFESGRLVKVGGARYQYFDGNRLLCLVSQLGQLLAKGTRR